MKKTIIVFSVFLASCGGASTERPTVDTNHSMIPGPDSSMILPPLTIDTLQPSDTLVVNHPPIEQ